MKTKSIADIMDANYILNSSASINSQNETSSIEHHSVSPQFLTFISIHVTLFLITTSVGISVNKKFLNIIDNQTYKERGKVLHKVARTHTLCHMAVGPVIFALVPLMFEHELKSPGFIWQYINGYSIFLCRFCFALFAMYTNFNSLITAICRGSFILYDQQLRDFGVGRFRKIIFGAAFGIPFFLAILKDATSPMEAAWIVGVEPGCDDGMSGQYHNSEENMATHDTLADINKPYCQTPMYNFVHKFLPSQVIYVARIVGFVSSVIILSNISEGIIYFRIYSFLKK